MSFPRKRESIFVLLTGLFLVLLLGVFIGSIGSIAPPPAQATVGDVTVDQSVGGSSTLGVVTAQKLVDSANSSYFLDPAATGNALVTAGDATVSGNIALGNTKTIRSAFGPLSLQYKSGLDTWATGLTLQDTTGNVGIGTTSPGSHLAVQSSGTERQIFAENTGSGNLEVLKVSQILPNTTWKDMGPYISFVGQTSSNAEANAQILSAWTNNADSTDAYLAFYTRSNSGLTEKMRIKGQGGNVGIGTTSPSTALQVVGTITGTTKNFEIDHPTKPGMKLIHSTVEGPEVAVFYRGEARLTNGKAVVILPDYFEALTRKEGRTVQLTAKNGWSPLYVDGEVTGGRFTVKADSGNASQQFFWEVKAVRADVEPLVVEKKGK
ncbi:MAG: hypothetical protein HY050_00275 [Actinobacteria bacterium]|nr:hypothetical protein [Actinomycetota bacterium]